MIARSKLLASLAYPRPFQASYLASRNSASLGRVRPRPRADTKQEAGPERRRHEQALTRVVGAAKLWRLSSATRQASRRAAPGTGSRRNDVSDDVG